MAENKGSGSETTRRGFLVPMEDSSFALRRQAMLSKEFLGALEPARAEYRRRVERLAEELRPRFVSGELHGYSDADFEQRTDDEFIAPIVALQSELRERISSDPEGYLILAVSPSEPLLEDGGVLEGPKSGAAQAMAMDVLRIARERGWYEPHPGEEPSRAELGA